MVLCREGLGGEGKVERLLQHERFASDKEQCNAPAFCERRLQLFVESDETCLESELVRPVRAAIHAAGGGRTTPRRRREWEVEDEDAEEKN